MRGSSAFLNLYAPQAVLPLLAQEFGAGPAQVSLTITASTLAVALTAPFTGAIADVVGRKRVITFAMLALIVPTAMVAFADSLQAMIFCRFAQGLMMPPIFAVIVAYIGEEWSAAEATGVTGIYTSAASFGGFLGRFLTGILADSIGWRGAFLADAALTLLCAAMVIVLLPREQLIRAATSLTASGRQMLRHLQNPRLLATFAIGFGVLFCFIVTFTYVSFHLAAPPFGLSAALLGSIFVVYLVGTVTTPLTGRLVARFGRRTVVIVSILAWIGRARADAGALACGHRPRSRHRGGLRLPGADRIDELRDDHRAAGRLIRRRALRHLVLYRRQRRGSGGWVCMERRWLARDGDAGGRDARRHGGDRRHRLAQSLNPGAGWWLRFRRPDIWSVKLLASPLNGVTFIPMKVTFDPAKREITLTIRGLDFEDAKKVFAGRHLVIESKEAQGESRFVTPGYLNDRFVIIVWTPRDGTRRIISMRHGHAKEERLYRDSVERS